MRVVSLNLRAYPNHDNIRKLGQLVAEQDPDVVLLQECRRSWLGVVCEEARLDFSAHSHDVPPRLPYRDFPPDGCAVATRLPYRLGAARRIDPAGFEPAEVASRIEEPTPPGTVMPKRLRARYSARSLLAAIAGPAGNFTACSFHATPGTGRVGGRQVAERKPFFHGAVALELQDLAGPFLFGIDANEPLAETPDAVTFHWEKERSGSIKLAALLGLNGSRLHRARDLQRQGFSTDRLEPAGPDHLFLTYNTGSRTSGNRRFDTIWATDDFELAGIQAHYEETLAAGGDHAMLVADLMP